MRRIVLVALCLFVFCSISLGCDPEKKKPGPDPNKECENHRTCWKKVCTQTDPNEYDSCVLKELSTQDSRPKYTECGSDNKCTVIPESDLGSGQVEVSYPAETKEKLAKDQVKWLRLYIFPSADMDGKKIDCKRLEEIYTNSHKDLMSKDLNRYYPPPDWVKPVTTDVIRVGDTLTLPFIELNVPKKSDNIVVVQGFCDPPEGRPDLETSHKWWACKEGVETKAGKDSNNISITLPVKNGDRCKK